MSHIRKTYSIKMFVLLMHILVLGQLTFAEHDHEHDEQPHTCTVCIQTVNYQNDCDIDSSDNSSNDLDKSTGISKTHNTDLYNSKTFCESLKPEFKFSTQTKYLPPLRGPPSK